MGSMQKSMKAAWEQKSFCLRDDESGAACSEERESTAVIVRKQEAHGYWHTFQSY